MASITDAQIDAAIECGTREQENEPRAAAARCDRQLDCVIVDLTNGCTFAFPPHLAQGLERADPNQLAKAGVLGRGCGLHWGAINVSLSIPGLMAGIFGTRPTSRATPVRRLHQPKPQRCVRTAPRVDALAKSRTPDPFSPTKYDKE